MAQKTDIRLRRSNVLNSVPGAANLSDGELAMNTNTGALYFKKSDATIITAADNTIFHIDSDTDNLGANKKIGIGETSPDRRLHVKDSNYRVAVFERTGSPNSYIMFADPNTTQDVGIGATTNNLKFRSGNVDHLSLLGSNGHLKFTDFDQQLEFGSSSNAIGYSSWNMSASAGGIIKNVVGPLRLNPDDFTAFQVNDVEKVRIDGTGLGIGTTAPATKLHVANGSDTSDAVRISGGHASRYLAIRTFENNSLVGAGISLNASSSGGAFKFQTTSTDRMTIANDGKVGIGTVSPATNLELSGSNPKLRITDTRNQTFTVGDIMSSIEFDSDDASGGAGTSSEPRAAINMYATTTFGSSTGLEFRTKTDSTDYPIQRMVIGADGNVGINASSPARRLEVNHHGATFGLRLTRGDNAGNSLMEFANTGGVKNIIGHDAGRSAFIIGPSTTPSVTIKNSTNYVGIGEDSPSSILHISDASSPEIRLEDSDATSTFNITTIQNAAGNLNYNTRQSDGTFVSTDYQIIKNAAGANIHKWFIGNSEKARLDASGNLLVGTTTVSLYNNSSEVGTRIGDGVLMVNRSANTPAYFNRLSTDGTIVDFRKNGASVGSIGTVDADLNIFSSASGHKGLRFGNGYIAPTSNSTTVEDASTDLGLSTHRFKDLHLSGTAKVDLLKVSSYETELSSGHLRFKFNGGAYIDQNTVGQSLNFRVSGSSSLDTTALTINSSGNSTFSGTIDSGNITSTGDVKADTHFTSSDSNATLSSSGSGGNVYLRPNGKGTATGETRINNSGVMVVNTTSTSHGLEIAQSTNTGYAPASILLKATQSTARGGGIYSYNTQTDNGWYSGSLYNNTNLWAVTFLNGTSFNPAIAQTTNAIFTIDGPNGRVGIGNTNPGTPLDVQSNSSAEGIRVRGRSSDSIGQISLTNNGGTARSQLQWNDSFFNIKALAAIPMIFYTNGTERMRIQSAGEVGIGTSSPGHKLHVVGANNTTPFSIDVGAAASYNFKANSNSTYSTTFNMDADGLTIGHDSAYREVALQTAGTNRLVIAPAGAITFNSAYTFPTTIGSAGQVLKVPTSGTELIWGAASGGGGGSSIADNDDDTKIQVEETADEDIIRFDIAGTQKMFLSSTQLGVTGDLAVSGDLNITGNINSTSVTDLDVTDKTITMAVGSGSSINADGAGIIIEGPSSNASLLWNHGNQQLRFNKEVFSPAGFVIGTTATNVGKMYNASGVMALEAYSSRSISFGNATNGEHVRINADGEVGIGTTNPEAALHISGTSAEQIKLERTNHDTFRIGLQSAVGLGFYNVTDSRTDMIISGAGNVGIGTVSPDSKLDVTGGDITINNNGTGFLNFKYGTAGSETSRGSVQTDGIDLKINATADLLLLPTGNVGIGTSSPAAKLHIVNNSTSVDALYLESTEDSSSAAPVLAFKRNSSSVANADYLGQLKFKGENDADQEVVYAKITAKILDDTDGTEDGLIEFANRKNGANEITARLRSDSLQLLNDTSLALKSDGAQIQLGNDNDMQIYHNGTAGEINNGTGDFTIDSVGDITIDAGGGDIRLKDDGTQFGRLSNFLGSLVITSSATDTAMMIGNTDGSVIMGGHVTLGDNSKSKYGNELEIYTNGTNAYIDEVGGGNLFIRSNEIRLNKYTGEYMIRAIADGAVTLYYDNNAKLATKADGVDITGELQSDSLDVDGNANISGNLVVAGGNHTFYSADSDIDFSIGRDATQALHIDVDDGNVKLTADQDSDSDGQHDFILDRTFDGTGQNNFKIRKGGSDQFVINKDGDVGIGETSPDGKLHIKGGTATGDASHILFENTQGSKVFAIGGGSTGVTNNNLFFRNVTDNTRPMVITDAGKVGIGTDSPGQPLHVKHSSTHQMRLQGSNSYWNIGTGWSGYYQDYLLFATNTGEKMVIDTAGKVGIGTNSPSARLDVRSSADPADGTLMFLRNEVSSGNGAFIRYDVNNVGDWAIGIPDNRNAFTIWKDQGNTGTEYFTVDSNGNVGIGTDTPVRKFHVYQPSGTNVVAEFESSDAQVWIDLQDSNSGSYGCLIGHDPAADHLFMVADSNVSRKLVIDNDGNVGIGTSSPAAKLQVEEYGIDTSTTSTAATTQVTIHSFPIADFRTARFTIQITNSTDSTYHSTEIIAVHDGTTANITEFGEVHTGSSVEATFDADISSSNFRLRATPTSTNAMSFKVVCHSITV